jgi:ABC-type xylose transport system substrate-binding protein
MVKARPGWTYLNVPMPDEEHAALKKMASGRKWRTFFKQMQDDALKAAKINQELREQLEFKDEQIKRLERDLARE